MRKLMLTAALIAAASVSQSLEILVKDLKCNDNKTEDNAKKFCKVIQNTIDDIDKNGPIAVDDQWAGVFGINVDFDDTYYSYAVIQSPTGVIATTTCAVRRKKWISSYKYSSSTLLAFCDESASGSGPSGGKVVHLEKATLSGGTFGSATVVGNVLCSEAFVPLAVKRHSTCNP